MNCSLLSLSDKSHLRDGMPETHGECNRRRGQTQIDFCLLLILISVIYFSLHTR